MLNYLNNATSFDNNVAARLLLKEQERKAARRFKRKADRKANAKLAENFRIAQSKARKEGEESSKYSKKRKYLEKAQANAIEEYPDDVKTFEDYCRVEYHVALQKAERNVALQELM